LECLNWPELRYANHQQDDSFLEVGPGGSSWIGISLLFSLLLLFQVVKKLWAYIRENNLQDPKNRKKIKCDEALRAVFHVNSIDMFQMNKALSKHIWPLTGENGTFLNKLFSFVSFCGGQWVVSCYWLLVASSCFQYVRLLRICMYTCFLLVLETWIILLWQLNLAA
jgi:hypothetical protein